MQHFDIDSIFIYQAKLGYIAELGRKSNWVGSQMISEFMDKRTYLKEKPLKVLRVDLTIGCLRERKSSIIDPALLP